jgi:hypothetical protein
MVAVEAMAGGGIAAGEAMAGGGMAEEAGAAVTNGST